MKYLVEITPKQVQTIQKLLDNGTYATLSQFISASIENQLSLEESDTTDLKPFQYESVVHPQVKTRTEIQTPEFEKYKLVNIPDFSSVVATPEYNDLVFSSAGARKIPEDQAWIWGQVNKIFPVKLGIRILHQLLANRQSIELNEFLETAAKDAAKCGNEIRKYETENNKMRGEKISAALPSSDEKSMTRYKFQFLVYPRKDERLDGAMAIMKLCNVFPEKKKLMIGLTESGLKFSFLKNPVIDDNYFERSLSEEESLFYLNHIKQNVKGEYAAIIWMLQRINSGKNEREVLNIEIEKEFGKIWGATDAVINTQRAGITARMFELGLIEKEKDGIYVKYGVSEMSKKMFLK